MIDHWSMILPDMGSRSDRIMPGTLLGCTPNSPRYSAGAFGFGSHISMWLGPPRIQRMMTDLFEPLAALDWHLSRSARHSPAAPNTPAFKKLRRSMRMRFWKSAQPIRVTPRLLISVSPKLWQVGANGRGLWSRP